MPPSCPHGDQPDVSLLRVVLIGEIVRADEALLVTLADLLHTSGLLPLAAAEPAAPRRRPQQETRQGLRLVGTHDQGRGSRRDAGTSQHTSRTHSHKPLNLLIIFFVGHIVLKNN